MIGVLKKGEDTESHREMTGDKRRGVWRGPSTSQEQNLGGLSLPYSPQRNKPTHTLPSYSQCPALGQNVTWQLQE
jgi:hypothetical protein